jgi:hypothetical protein
VSGAWRCKLNSFMRVLALRRSLIPLFGACTLQIKGRHRIEKVNRMWQKWHLES